MTSNSRRGFLQSVAQLAAASAAVDAVPEGICQALTIPAHNAYRNIEDVQHIVVLMQEDRSFGHYFGTLRSVHEYGDMRTVTLPSGKSMWHQSVAGSAGEVLPFRPSMPDLGLQFLQDLPHGQNDMHFAASGGCYDDWAPHKGTMTMAYLTCQDTPFHHAPADVFAICDAYRCAMPTSTDPNRYYMWIGYIGNDSVGGGPVISNTEAGYGWSTYSEVLEVTSISRRIHQDIDTGLDAAGSWDRTSDAYIGSYDDDSLLYFRQYQNAQPGNPLYDKTHTDTNTAAGKGYFDILKRDVWNGTLPQASWITVPETFSEHPNWSANYGAWYTDQVLQILTSNPEVWSKTAVFVTYDENDSFFDRLVPLSTSSDGNDPLTVDTTGEYFPGSSTYGAGGYGLGQHVSMFAVPP